MMGKICSWCIVLLCFLVSCSEEEKSGEVFTPADYAVKGKVEKGPFIKGSTIILQPLDSKMNSLGTSYPGIILDDDGAFDTFSFVYISLLLCPNVCLSKIVFLLLIEMFVGQLLKLNASC
jgi:hypothetical protein